MGGRQGWQGRDVLAWPRAPRRALGALLCRRCVRPVLRPPRLPPPRVGPSQTRSALPVPPASSLPAISRVRSPDLIRVRRGEHRRAAFGRPTRHRARRRAALEAGLFRLCAGLADRLPTVIGWRGSQHCAAWENRYGDGCAAGGFLVPPWALDLEGERGGSRIGGVGEFRGQLGHDVEAAELVGEGLEQGRSRRQDRRARDGLREARI